MAKMEFYRTPTLAGNTTTHQTYAVVRGSIRRNDPDFTSSVPYFSGAVSGGTLDMYVDDVPSLITVTFSGAGISTVISDINAAFAAAPSAARAFDADGCIGIKSGTLGAGSYVYIEGGTAADLIGFDNKVTGVPVLGSPTIFSTGGEVASTPEARVGNPFGTAFLAKGENLTADGVNRGLHALSRNLDVVYADVSRKNVVLKSMGTLSNYTAQAPIPWYPIYTGFRQAGSLLNASSSAQDLAPYFFLMDTATGLPAKSKVVAIGRGTLVGTGPFANATSWSGLGSSGNILGISLTKVGPVAISTIQGGRVVSCPSADFSSVTEGDFVEIQNATNTDKWSNNGRSWVVESVIDTTTLALRPMSRSELSVADWYPETRQPVVELQSEKGPLQSYGNLLVYSGPFYKDQSGTYPPIFVINPPIPDGATYELFAAVGDSLRESEPHVQHGAMQAVRELASNLDPVENWTLSGLDAALSGGNCVIADGYIRWHGKAYKLPGRSLSAAAFSNGLNYVYWAESSGNIEISTSLSNWAGALNDSYLSPTGKGQLIAIVGVSAGIITSVQNTVRRRMERATTVTVGVGGQFKNLKDAGTYLTYLAQNYSEGDSSDSGSYPHVEITLVSNQTLDSAVGFGTSVTIRGAHSGITLTLNAELQCSGPRLELKDLKLVSSAALDNLILLTGTTSAELISFTNVVHTSAGRPGSLVYGYSRGLTKLVIKDSSFVLSQCIVQANGSSASTGVDTVILQNSTFTRQNPAPLVPQTPHLITRPYGVDWSNTWNGSYLLVRDCSFEGQFGSGASADGYPAFVGTSSATSVLDVQNVRISLGNYGSSVTTSLFECLNASRATFENVVMTEGKIPIAIKGGDGTIVKNCVFATNGELSFSATYVNSAVSAAYVSGCTITHSDRDSLGNASVGIFSNSPKSVIENNTISGPFYKGIVTNGEVCEGTVIAGNTINTSWILNAYPGTGIDAWNGSADGPRRCRIADNNISLTAGDATRYGIEAFSASNCTITGNVIRIQDASAPSPTSIGVRVANSFETAVSANTVEYVGTLPGTQYMKGIDIDSSQNANLTGNIIKLSPSADLNWVGVSASSATGFILSSNTVHAAGIPLYVTSPPSDCTISNNQFLKSSTNNAYGSGVITGLVSGNTFGIMGSATTHPITFGSGYFSDNTFYGNTSGTSLQFLRFDNNSVYGTFSATTAANLNLSLKETELIIQGSYFTSTVSVTCSRVNQKVTLENNKMGGGTTVTASGLTGMQVVAINNVGTSMDVGFPAHATIVGNNLSSTLTANDGNTRYLVSGNRVAGAYTANNTSGSSVITNNAFAAVTIYGTGRADYVLGNNLISGDFLLSNATNASTVKIEATKISGTCTVTLVNAPNVSPSGGLTITDLLVGSTSSKKATSLKATYLSVQSSEFYGDVSLDCSLSKIAHNRIEGAYNHTSTYLTGTVAELVSNTITGTSVKAQLSATSGFGQLTLTDNIVEFAVSSTDLKLRGDRCALTGNRFLNIANLSTSIELWATRLICASNTFGAKTLNLSDGGSTTLSIAGTIISPATTASVDVHDIQNNVFYCRIAHATPSSNRVRFVDNFLFYTGGSVALSFNASNNIHIRGNSIRHTSSTTDFASSTLVIDGATYEAPATYIGPFNVEILDNDIQMDRSGSYTASKTWAIVSSNSPIGIRFQNNRMRKTPDDSTGGFTKTVNYLLLTTGRRMLVAGNFLTRGDEGALLVVGTADTHKGGGYPNATTPYTDGQSTLTITENSVTVV